MQTLKTSPRQWHPWVICLLLAWATTVLALPAVESSTSSGLPDWPPGRWVLDSTERTLSTPQQERLQAQLADWAATSGAPIAVLVLETAHGQNLEALAHSALHAGRPDARSPALLILVLRADQQARIQVAPAWRLRWPDSAMQAVMNQQLLPAFRQGEFATGLEAALTVLQQPASVAAANPNVGGGNESPKDLADWATLIMPVLVGGPLFGAVLGSFLGRWIGVLLAGPVVGALVWHLETLSGPSVRPLVLLSSVALAWLLAACMAWFSRKRQPGVGATTPAYPSGHAAYGAAPVFGAMADDAGSSPNLSPSSDGGGGSAGGDGGASGSW